MRHFCSFLLFIFVSLSVSSQHVYKIKTDSLLVTNDSCTAELNLENSTKFVNGFLYNKGKGRTEFRRAMIKLTDSTYLFGDDTLNFRSLLNTIGFTGTNIYNSDGTLSGNRTVTLGGFSLNFSGDIFANSVAIGRGYGSFSENTVIGTNALALTSNTGNFNVAVGNNAMLSNTSGNQSVAVGSKAMEFTTSGTRNTAVGRRALQHNSIGSWNTAVGIWALVDEIGSYNTAIGGYNGSGVPNGLANNHNFLGGISAGTWLNGSSYNVLLGNFSGYDITAADNNTFLGYNTGRGIVTGGGNTIIGANVTGLPSTLANNIILASGDGIPKLQVFDNGNVAIGSNPSDAGYKLDINGTSRFKQNITYEGNIVPANPILYGSDIGITKGTTGWGPALIQHYFGGNATANKLMVTYYGFHFNETNSVPTANGQAFVGLWQNSASTAPLLAGGIGTNNVPTIRFFKEGLIQARTISATEAEDGYRGNPLYIAGGNPPAATIEESMGTNLILKSGLSYGTGTNGWTTDRSLYASSVLFQTSDPTGTVSVAQNAYTTKMIIYGINQNVGIGTTTPVVSAALDIVSTTKGFLPPRWTQSQRTTITSPATGLLGYQTDSTENLYLNKSTGWKRILTEDDNAGFTNIYNSNGILVSNRFLDLGTSTLSVGKGANSNFHVFNNGNVWMGNGLPVDAGYKLDVAGHAKLTGNLIIGSSIRISPNTFNKTSINESTIVIGTQNNTGILQDANVLIGWNAGSGMNGANSSEASNNIMIGRDAGSTNITTGKRNIILGTYVGSSVFFNVGNVSDKILVGNGGAGAGGILLGGDMLQGQLWVNPSTGNITNADASVAFGINAVGTSIGGSTNVKGFLPPRWTTTQRTGINTPATGLLGYQTDNTENLYLNKSTGWKRILTEDDNAGFTNIYNSNGSLNSNRFVNLDTSQLSFGKNSTAYMHLFNNGNVWLGNNSTPADAGYKLDITGNSRISGILQMSRESYNSIWIGTHGNAMNMTENWGVNVVIGSHTASGTISTENVLIGHNSGKNLSGSGLQEAFSNVIVGSNSGHTFTTGGRNIIIGSYAGYGSFFNAGNGNDKLIIGSGGNGIGGHILGGDILNGNLWVNPTPVNVSSPDPSVAFGINATNTNIGGSNLIKGFLPPKWTQSQRTSINSPATGLIGYQTDSTENLFLYKSTGWKKILTEDNLSDATNIYNANGALTSNRFVNLNTSTYSIGKDTSSYFHLFNGGNLWLGNSIAPADAGYKLDVQGTSRFNGRTLISTNQLVFGERIAIGSNGTFNKTVTSTAIVIGYQGSAGNIPGDNIIIGYDAGSGINSTDNLVGSNNIFIGRQAGSSSITTGVRNTFIGTYSGSNLSFFNLGNVSNKVAFVANGANSGAAWLGGDALNGTIWINPTVANVVTPDNSVAFGINAIPTGSGASTSPKGFLPPRMTGSEAEAISSPAEGLMIYATNGNGTVITSKGWWGYNGTTWEKLNN